MARRETQHARRVSQQYSLRPLRTAQVQRGKCGLLKACVSDSPTYAGCAPVMIVALAAIASALKLNAANSV